MLQTPEEILVDVRKILGEEIRITKRNWAVYWCPHHPDEAQKGGTGEPNFGVDLNTGRYNCFRCGFKGGSLRSLAKAVGAEYAPKNVEFIKRRPKQAVNGGHEVSQVQEAIADAQSRLLKSPAMTYLKERGVTPYTAMMYGLGYAVGRVTARAQAEADLRPGAGAALVENPDILAAVASAARRPLLVVGFAAETEDVVANAVTKRQAKGCDWVIANDVAPGSGVFGGNRNTVHLVTRRVSSPGRRSARSRWHGEEWLCFSCRHTYGCAGVGSAAPALA